MHFNVDFSAPTLDWFSTLQPWNIAISVKSLKVEQGCKCQQKYVYMLKGILSKDMEKVLLIQSTFSMFIEDLLWVTLYLFFHKRTVSKSGKKIPALLELIFFCETNTYGGGVHGDDVSVYSMLGRNTC